MAVSVLCMAVSVLCMGGASLAYVLSDHTLVIVCSKRAVIPEDQVLKV